MFTLKKLHYPKIPRNLILSLDDVKKQPGNPLLRSDGGEDVLDKIKSYRVNDELLAWIKDNIDIDVMAEYVVMNTWTFKHVDTGRSKAINYVILTGGDWVATEFFDPTDPDKRIDAKVMPPEQWHMINASIPHAVTGLKGNPTTRYILSLTPVEDAFWCILPNATI